MKSVTIDLHGEAYTFSPETTLCVVHRVETDVVYNYVQTVHNGNRAVLFDNPRLISYLGGIAVPNTGLSDKKLLKLTSAMDDEFGWESNVLIRDTASKEIKKKYTSLLLRSLNGEVTFPEDWCKSTS